MFNPHFAIFDTGEKIANRYGCKGELTKEQISAMDRDFRIFGDAIYESIIQIYEIYNAWITANLPLTWEPTGTDKNSGKQNVDSHQSASAEPGPRTRGSGKKARGGGNAAADNSKSKKPSATRNKGRKRTQSDSDSLSDSRTPAPLRFCFVRSHGSPRIRQCRADRLGHYGRTC